MKYIKYFKWLLESQLGIDFIRLIRFIKNYPRFLYQYFTIRRLHKVKTSLKPCLHDSADYASSQLAEYFYQDLFVAQKVFKENPKTLADVGSRVDGYVSNVASFREITVIDIRKLPNNISNVKYLEQDITKNIESSKSFDMVTCLHALEHFGLGRYGDPIIDNAVELGIKGLTSLLKKDGKLIISTPTGKERIEFNANWVFDAKKLCNIFDSLALELRNIYQFNPINKAFDIVDINNINHMSNIEYALTIFELYKK